MTSRDQELTRLVTLAGNVAPAQCGPILAELFSMLTSPTARTANSKNMDMLEQLALRVLEHAPLDERLRFSTMTANCSSTPWRVLFRLASDQIEIAGQVLESPRLTQGDLRRLVAITTADHHCVIAGRSDMDQALAATLIENENETVLKTVASNQRARLSEATLKRLVELSRQYQTLQIPLLQRPDLPHWAIRELRQNGSQQLRTYIDVSFKKETLDAALPPIHDRSRDSLTASDPKAKQISAIETIDQLAAQGRLRHSILLKALHQGNMDLLIAGLSYFAAMPFAVLKDLVREVAVVPLARISKTTGINRQNFDTILILTRRLQGMQPKTSDDERQQIDRIYSQFGTHEIHSANYAA